MTRKLITALFTVLLIACSGSSVSYYASGDPMNRVYGDLISWEQIQGRAHHRVTRNEQGKIIKVKEFDSRGVLLTTNGYKYTRDGRLISRQEHKFYYRGPEQTITEWLYEGDRLMQREEHWYTRDRSFEKRVTVYFDPSGRPYLEETHFAGMRLVNSTEFYYDYYGHLDKSRRNFFLVGGEVRDYWITIYDDREAILVEEHYLPDNTLLAFYRYTYHPAEGWVESEEILDENRQQFIRRNFTRDGRILMEARYDRQMNLLKRVEYVYDEQDRPKQEIHYGARGKQTAVKPYQRPILHEGYRRPN